MRNFTDFLAQKPPSVDRYVLLDAQDWMSDAQLNALWTEITRTAAPGARVIFRTAAERACCPAASDALLDQWRYRGGGVARILRARPLGDLWRLPSLCAEGDADERGGRDSHAELMDGVYRHQRHIYDSTRKYYLLGRDRLIAGLACRRAARCSRSAAAPAAT